MPNWKGIVAKDFSPQEFDDYCHHLQWTAWRPSFIVLHNTAIPTLAQRPNGLSLQNIKDLEVYYRDQAPNKNGPPGWSAGPHLFIDDKKIWVFTPLTVSGIHSPSYNKIAFGIEMLGDYAKESFDSGRGLAVRNNTIAALATLNAILGLDPFVMKIHREDPLTTHICPGASVRKLEVIQQVHDLLIERHAGEHSIESIA